MNFNNKQFKLTEREQDFIQKFLDNNGCGARTPCELLDDNFSCQCIEDLRSIFHEMSEHQIGGFLSSLQTKGIIFLEYRDGPVCESNDRIKQLMFEPNLYWITEDYLKSLDQDLLFETV